MITVTPKNTKDTALEWLRYTRRCHGRPSQYKETRDGPTPKKYSGALCGWPAKRNTIRDWPTHANFRRYYYHIITSTNPHCLLWCCWPNLWRVSRQLAGLVTSPRGDQACQLAHGSTTPGHHLLHHKIDGLIAPDLASVNASITPIT